MSLSKAIAGQTGSDGTDGTDGLDGTSAKTLVASIDSQVMAFDDSSDTSATPTEVVFSFNQQNLNDSIGNSIKTLFAIAEGKHSFCQKLVKAKTPFIILGSSVKKRLDSNSMSSLLIELAKYCHIIDENWLGVNFLPLTL